ncbi:MAG: dihydroorotase [Betaproteobacteria bacterium]|nr:dihydroorotase [Betaproteobacteria bacterium]
MKIHIRGGRVIDPASGLDAVQDLYIAEGRIAGLGKRPEGFRPEHEIDASNLVICPGLIDLAVRLREPGYEHIATLESEMNAAVAGGVTSLACLPDTDPPLDEPGLVEMLKHRARNLNQARVYPLGALTQGLRGERLTEMAELTEAGCIAFTQADAPLVDTAVLMSALQYASTFDYRVWLRPQEHFLGRGGVAHDGQVATRLGLAGIPVSAETIAIATILHLMRDTDARVHFCRISSAAGLAMLREARAQGLKVTCDLSIHHLHLSEMDIGYYDSNCHLVPPLRSQRDRDALRAGLSDGTIDALCSDHTPVDEDAKQLPFAESDAGATGLELLLPLTLKWGEESAIPLAAALARITCEPARILGIQAGRLSVGGDADLCVFDPDSYWRIDAQSLRSMGKNTPFFKWELRGQVHYTLVEGQVVYALGR